MAAAWFQGQKSLWQGDKGFFYPSRDQIRQMSLFFPKFLGQYSKLLAKLQTYLYSVAYQRPLPPAASAGSQAPRDREGEKPLLAHSLDTAPSAPLPLIQANMNPPALWDKQCEQDRAKTV